MWRENPLPKDYLNIANRVNETATGITVIDKEDKKLLIMTIKQNNDILYLFERYDKWKQ